MPVRKSALFLRRLWHGPLGSGVIGGLIGGSLSVGIFLGLAGDWSYTWAESLLMALSICSIAVMLGAVVCIFNIILSLIRYLLNEREGDRYG